MKLCVYDDSKDKHQWFNVPTTTWRGIKPKRAVLVLSAVISFMLVLPALAQTGAPEYREPWQKIPAAPPSASASAPELRQTWKDIAKMLAVTGNDAAAIEVQQAVAAISDADMVRIYGQVDLGAMLFALGEVEGAIEAVELISDGEISVKSYIQSSSGYFDSPDYPDTNYCPSSPNRSDDLALQIAVDAIQAARIALEGAKVLWSGLSRLCDQTVVVCPAPGGGNTSTACIAADVVLFAAELAVGAAEGVVEHFEFCDNGVDSAEIEGTWERVGHIHTDLDNHNTDISTQLLTHDEDIKELLDDIQDGIDENHRLITVFMARQQEVLRLLITPEGRRAINPTVMVCTGPDCPETLVCSKGNLSWPCK